MLRVHDPARHDGRVDKWPRRGSRRRTPRVRRSGGAREPRRRVGHIGDLARCRRRRGDGVRVRLEPRLRRRERGVYVELARGSWIVYRGTHSRQLVTPMHSTPTWALAARPDTATALRAGLRARKYVA